MNDGAHSGADAPHACEAAPDGGRIDWRVHRALRVRSVIWGIVAAGFLLAVYFGILTLANSADHAVQELLRLWYWMVPLVLGFSVQIGLFAYARRATRQDGGVHSRGVVASGGASTVSMVACCAHHLTDVLPIIGLAGAATVLATYQGLFLLLGVLSNVVGLVYVLGMLRRHGLYPTRRSWLSGTLRWPFERMLIPVVGLSVLVLTLSFVTAVV